MSIEIIDNSKRLFTLGVASLVTTPLVSLFSDEAKAEARFREFRWGRMKKFASGDTLFVDARVVNVEKRTSAIPGEIRRENLIEVEFDHNLDPEFRFLNDREKDELIRRMGLHGNIVVMCEAGERSRELGKEIVEISKREGSGSKVKMVYSLEGGLRGIGEDRTAEAKIDNLTEKN